MSPTPEPAPGTYYDRCGTRYEATKHPKTGWWVQRLTGHKSPGERYPKPDFVAAVNAGIFVLLSDPQAR